MKKILWIEDDYLRLKGLMLPLEKIGFCIDYVADYASMLKMKLDSYDLFIVDLILPQKEVGEIVIDKEYIPMPGVKIVDELDKLRKPIIILTVVRDQEIFSHLKNKQNVRSIMTKGNIFPSDFKSEVLEILGVSNNGNPS